MTMFREEVPNYRYQGFQQSTVAPSHHLGKNHRIVHQFHGSGVERHANVAESGRFVYGSDVKYDNQDGRQRFSDRTKLRRQQQQAEADIEAHRNAKTRLQHELAVEKKQDLEMLQCYNPWGKPAGGAPRVTPSGTVDSKRMKFDQVNSGKPDYSPFGRPGAGAPLRSDSGHTITSLRGDPDTRFQKQLRGEVNHLLRYKDGSLLEKQNGDRYIHRTESERMRKLEEKEKKLRYGKRLEEQRVEAMERKAKEKAEKKVADAVYYPWGRDQPDRDDSGKIQGRRQIVDKDVNPNNKYAGLAFQMGRLGGNAPFRHKVAPNVDIATDIHDPWGKPGAGAPIRNKSGKLLTTIYGKCYSEKHGKDVPVTEVIQHSMEEKGEEGKRKLKGHGMDVASWLRAGVVGQPKRSHDTEEIIGSSKSTSDVTTKRLNIHHQNNSTSREYYTDLQKQAEMRHRKLQQQKEEDRQLELQHAEKISKVWGGGRRPPNPFRRSWERREASNDEEQATKKRDYCEQLQKMILDRNEQRKQSRETDLVREKQHIEKFDRQWGRPGAGAPRLNEHGEVDAVPKTFGSLLHMGQHFRRA